VIRWKRKKEDIFEEGRVWEGVEEGTVIMTLP
jgi:hypothetical protein